MANAKELRKTVTAEVKAERARRKAKRIEIRALPRGEQPAARKAEKSAQKAAKLERKHAIHAMPKQEKRAAKKHDKLTKRIWNRPRRIVIWAVVLCLLAFGIFSAAPYIGDFTSLYSMKIDSNTSAGDAARINGAKVAEEIADEGIVLLKNADDLLPLTGGKLNVFGYAAYNIRYGGSGSGGGDASSATDLFAGLSNAGIAYNETLDAFYRAQKDISQKGSSNGLISVLVTMLGKPITDEPAIDYLTQDALAQARDYSDTALVVIGSDGVEASDFTRDALKLTKNRSDLLDQVCANFDNVIVVINAGNAMELGFLDQYPSIKAALWIGTPGPKGCLSLGNILAGKVNPSGRLVDTYAYDAASSPASVNFGDYKYDNIYVWANEQAIRELYLRPFEITVKEGKVTGAMSSFVHIGYKWCGGNPELLEQVLRKEWGFVGVVTTDAVLGSFMDANLALHNGNDLMLAVMPTNNRRYLEELFAKDPVGVTKGLRERMHNFCYALVNDTDLF